MAVSEPTRNSPVGLLLFLLMVMAAGLAWFQWLTDAHAPPVSGYSEER